MVLERGVGQLRGTGYGIEARSLRVVADEANATARVSLSGDRRVLVAALQGRSHVTNAQGMLVANLTPGIALEFEPQGEGADVASKLKGVLRRQAGKFLLTDETTNVTVELRGSGLSSKVGKRVEVTGQLAAGSVAVEPGTQVINVKTITLAAAAAVAGAGAGTAGAASAAGATAAGIGAGTVAIVGGVAAAGTVAGLGITGSLPGQGDEPQQNSSR
jgi:hypothetical protein